MSRQYQNHNRHQRYLDNHVYSILHRILADACMEDQVITFTVCLLASLALFVQ